MAIFLSLFYGVGAGAPLAPESAAEDARATSIHLAADRVLRSQTRQSHGQLIEQFQTWLFFEHGISWNDLFGKKPWDPELFGWWLIAEIFTVLENLTRGILRPSMRLLFYVQF
jgi:hypothetical protein